MPGRALRSLVVVTALAATATGLLPGVAHAGGSSTLSGSVWNDANRNGVRDSGEAPFSNVIIDVYAGSTFVTSVNTDANGSYQATGLADGTYTVFLDGTSWSPLRDTWVATTTSDLQPSRTITLTGAAVADLGLRQIVRSTTVGSPLSTYKAPNGFVANSYDDAVTAQQLYSDLAGVQLMGAEAALTTLNFDSPNSYSDTYSSVSGGPPYFNFHATMYVSYDSWVMSGDETLVHEYGHAWSTYNADITQQDPTYAAYLQARGLTGNPSLGTSWTWEPSELIAEDYRQLFGTPTAASYPQANTEIPPAASVPGLKSFLQNTYDTASQPPTPSVTAVSPATAPSTGGTTVTVSGTGFSGSGWSTSAVRVGGAAASFTVQSPTQLTVVLPPGTGTQDLTVTTSSTTSATATSVTSTADQVTYLPQPTVTSLTPTSGSLKGGTTVTVYGSGFAGPGVTLTSVTFGKLSASKITVVSPTQLTVVSPASATTGSVHVTVTTTGGTSATSTADVFTYKRK